MSKTIQSKCHIQEKWSMFFENKFCFNIILLDSQKNGLLSRFWHSGGFVSLVSSETILFTEWLSVVITADVKKYNCNILYGLWRIFFKIFVLFCQILFCMILREVSEIPTDFKLRFEQKLCPITKIGQWKTSKTKRLNTKALRLNM